MKKLLSASLAAVLAIGSLCAFAACGDTHDYVLQYDETNHWYVCSDCGDVKDTAGHSMKNGKCETCGFVQGTEGLTYEIHEDGLGYELSGLGTAATTDITVASMYRGLPVTAIGEYAFYDGGPNGMRLPDPSPLTSIVIPDSVTTIETSAFEACVNLTSVTLGNGVTVIGNGSFYTCFNLTSINIPDSVTTVGDVAFFGCSNLAQITGGNGITSIAGQSKIGDLYTGSFTGTAFFDNESNWEDGVLYLGKCLLAAKNTVAGNYRVKNGTVTIAINAFANCEELTGVTIPDSVTAIGEGAFYDCTKLADIEIGNGVTSFGFKDESYFEADQYVGCVFTGTAFADKQSNWEHGALYLGNYLVATRGGTISDDMIQGDYRVKDGTTVIAWGAFQVCYGLTSITFPDSVKIIGDYAVITCWLLEEITIGSGVSQIGQHAFAFNHSRSLTNITVSAENGAYSSKGNCLIETATKTLIKGCTDSMIPDDGSVTSIAPYAFCALEIGENSKIPSGVTSIGDYAFSGTINAEKIVIPNSVVSIGEGAFSCDRYESFLTTLELGNNIVYIGKNAFASNSMLTSIVLPDSVIKVDQWAFVICNALKTVTFGSGLQSIGKQAFWSPVIQKPVETEIGSGIFVEVYVPGSPLESVTYRGSKEAWNAISKSDFEEYLSVCTIACTDGNIVFE